jgi:hypothetical protein
MRVSITSGGATHHLAGESGVSERVHSSAGGLSISADIQTSSRAGVRKAAAGVRDRLNLQTTISFTTSRLFATPALAEAWALDYDSTFHRAGNLRIDTVAGATTTTRYMNDCVVLPPSRQVIGCSVLLQYTAIGGAITSS